MKEENEDMNIIYHNLKGADKAVPGREWIYSTQFSNQERINVSSQ